MLELSAIFQDVIDTIEERTPPADTISHASDGAAAALQSKLSETILARRITLRAENGARLSVVAKNRRVIKIAEVHPPELWQHTSEPQDTTCIADYETFARPFASTVFDVIGDGPVKIEQALIGDPIGKTGAGYPASKLTEHVAQAQQRSPAPEKADEFFEAFPEMARARFGDKDAVDLPDASKLTADWMQEQIDGLSGSLADKDSDVRFLVLTGEAPRALALVWLDGAGCLIVAEDTDTFDALEQRIDDLRPYL